MTILRKLVAKLFLYRSPLEWVEEEDSSNQNFGFGFDFDFATGEDFVFDVTVGFDYTPYYRATLYNTKDFETMPKERTFEVGDMVTYKGFTQLKEETGNAKYEFGGNDYGGSTCKVTEVYSYYGPHSDCWKIEVKIPDGGTYTMLESEFLEYNKNVKLVDKVNLRLKIITIHSSTIRQLNHVQL